jgi:hypothetical protein
MLTTIACTKCIIDQLGAISPLLPAFLWLMPIFHVLTGLLLPNNSWMVRILRVIACLVLHFYGMIYVPPVVLLSILLVIENVWSTWGTNRQRAALLSGVMAAGVLLLGGASILFPNTGSPEHRSDREGTLIQRASHP